MAGTLFENNLSPYLTLVESAAPSSPSAGNERLFVDTADKLLKLKNSAGTVTPVATAASGSITASGYTQSTAKMLGRSTASTGAIEEIAVGSGLTLSGGTLSASGGGGSASGCIACRTTTVTSGSDGYTIPWNGTDVFDPDGYHDPAGAHPERLTVPTGKGGRLFYIAANVEHGTSATSGAIRIAKNGSAILSAGPVSQAFLAVCDIVAYLADGDYVEVQTVGMNGYTLTNADYPLQFAIAPIG